MAQRTRLTSLAAALVGMFLATGVLHVAAGARQAAAASIVVRSFVHVGSAALDSAAARDRVATNYEAVIIRGRVTAELIRDLKQRNSSLQVYIYEQSAALNSTEVSTLEAAHAGWLARSQSGRLIHPVTIPHMTLGDITKAGFRTWKASIIAKRVALGADGTFLDTLAAVFPEGFYTEHPYINGAPVTDAAWRNGGAALIDEVQAATGKVVIANGRGLASGGGYQKNPEASDVLINAADGVQLEVFTRQLHTPINQYASESRWAQDVEYLNLLGTRGKISLAYTKVGVAATDAQITAVRDYALGTYLMGFVPGKAYFGFSDNGLDVPRTPSSASWSRSLGAPTGAGTETGVRTRTFEAGVLAVNPSPIAQQFGGALMPPHTVLVR